MRTAFNMNFLEIRAVLVIETPEGLLIQGMLYLVDKHLLKE